MNFTLKRAMVAGVVGTAAMTGLMLAAPMMGMPPMNIGEMLASRMGGLVALGWAAHFMIGIVLAVVYAAVFATRLPGPGAARGAAFALVPWLMAQMIVMPMMGMGVFSGSALMAGGSLMGHLLYGAVMGGVYARGSAHSVVTHAVHA